MYGWIACVEWAGFSCSDWAHYKATLSCFHAQQNPVTFLRDSGGKNRIIITTATHMGSRKCDLLMWWADYFRVIVLWDDGQSKAALQWPHRTHQSDLFKGRQGTVCTKWMRCERMCFSIALPYNFILSWWIFLHNFSYFSLYIGLILQSRSALVLRLF